MIDESGFGEPVPGASELGVHEVVHFAQVASTMDEAHALAQRGARAGTLVIADEQTSGRGRSGNVWESRAHRGVWLTLIERPSDAAAVDVLSIRLGLAVAESVESLADGPILLKWPNDVFVGAGKLAGILVEARWREGAVDWVAIGIGLNLEVPELNRAAAALKIGTTRNDVLRRMIPAIHAAAQQHGTLSEAELLAWAARDLAVGKAVSAPVAGTVRGIEANGSLRVEDASGTVHAVRAGSLVFA